jgi:hypothetical protein
VTVVETGVVWRTGNVFDSTWQPGCPESFMLGGGQPESFMIGAGVKTTDTAVFVIDIFSALGSG